MTRDRCLRCVADTTLAAEPRDASSLREGDGVGIRQALITVPLSPCRYSETATQQSAFSSGFIRRVSLAGASPAWESLDPGYRPRRAPSTARV